LPPSKPCIRACSEEDKELYKQRNFFVARHWWLYLLVILIGVRCLTWGVVQQTFKQFVAYQCVGYVFLGLGLWALFSLIPPRCCNDQANVAAERPVAEHSAQLSNAGPVRSSRWLDALGSQPAHAICTTCSAHSGFVQERVSGRTRHSILGGG
jgi:hypothetical protein